METKRQVLRLWAAVVVGAAAAAGVSCIDADLGTVPTCISGGITYHAGDQVPDENNCGVCKCNSNGSVGCMYGAECYVDAGAQQDLAKDGCYLNGTKFGFGAYYELGGCPLCVCSEVTHVMTCENCGGEPGRDAGIPYYDAATSPPDGGGLPCDERSVLIVDAGPSSPHLPWGQTPHPCGWCSHGEEYWPPGSSFVEASPGIPGECDSCVCSDNIFRCTHAACTHFDGGISFP